MIFFYLPCGINDTSSCFCIVLALKSSAFYRFSVEKRIRKIVLVYSYSTVQEYIYCTPLTRSLLCAKRNNI